MSAQLSPDGMFYWDGRQWMSTLSPDGRTRWNGTAWLPTGRAYGPPQYQSTGRTSREATSWTRPLRLAVAAWYAFEGVYALTLPFWMSGPLTQVMNQSIQHSEQLNPSATPPPADFMNFVTSIMGGVLWVAALFSLALAVVAVIGAFERWTWVYYVVLIFLGLGAISLPLAVVDALGGSAITGASMPTWTYWVGVLTDIPGTALFVWMLVALVKRGPWAMRKVTPQPG